MEGPGTEMQSNVSDANPHDHMWSTEGVKGNETN